jgi:hypothetical protein
VGHCELETVGSSLHSTLLLQKPIDRGFVEQVQDTGERHSSGKAVQEVGIKVSSGDDRLAKRCWNIIWGDLFNIALNAFPVKGSN